MNSVADMARDDSDLEAELMLSDISDVEMSEQIISESQPTDRCDHFSDDNWDEDCLNAGNSPMPYLQKRCSKTCKESGYCPRIKKRSDLSVPNEKVGIPVETASADANDLSSIYVPCTKSSADAVAIPLCESIPVKNGRQLYVQNINFRTRQHQLRKFFSEYGKISHCELKMDPARKKSKGCCTITFTKKCSADTVLALESCDLILHDRNINIGVARRKQTIRDVSARINCLDEDVNVHGKSDGDAILTNDVMLMIFSFLPVSVRVGVQRVSKRWWALSKRSLQSVKELDVTQVLPMFKRTDSVMFKLFNNRLSGITHLSVNGSASHLTDRTISKITHICHLIIHLDLTGMKLLTNKGVRKLANCYANMQCIILDGCSQVGDLGMSSLFGKCRYLKTVNLDNCSRLKGQCFHVMSSTVETVKLKNAEKVKDVGVRKLALRGTNLRHLDLRMCKQITASGLQVLLTDARLRNLERLHLSPTSHLTTLALLGNLINLRHLELDFSLHFHFMKSHATLAMIDAIVAGCSQLRLFHMAGLVELLDDACVCRLAMLAHLHDVAIAGADNITDVAVKALACRGVLQRLNIASCSKVTDASIAALVKHCLLLNFLDVTGCRKLTTEGSLMPLLQMVKERPEDDRKLHVLMRRTDIDLPSSELPPGFTTDLTVRDNNADDDYYGYSGDEYYDSDDSGMMDRLALAGEYPLFEDDDGFDLEDIDDPLFMEQFL